MGKKPKNKPSVCFLPTFGSEAHIAYVQTWKSFMINLETPCAWTAHFQKLKEELNPEEVYEIAGFKEAITVHSCKARSDAPLGDHEPFCFLHPDVIVCFIDDDENAQEVRSIYLKPVEFQPQAENATLHGDVSTGENVFEPPGSETVPRDEARELITVDHSEAEAVNTAETVEEIGEPATLNEIIGSIVDECVEFQKVTSAGQTGECARKKYSLCLFFADGRVAVKNAEDAQGEEFIFDPVAGDCVYADKTFDIGQVQFFQDRPEHSAMVIEGDPEQLKNFTNQLLVFISERVNKGIEKAMPKVL